MFVLTAVLLLLTFLPRPSSVLVVCCSERCLIPAPARAAHAFVSCCLGLFHAVPRRLRHPSVRRWTCEASSVSSQPSSDTSDARLPFLPCALASHSIPSQFRHACSPEATCHNTDGSYECHCAAGYAGDGMTTGQGCVDVTPPTIVRFLTHHVLYRLCRRRSADHRMLLVLRKSAATAT